ncbi:MAG TPA: phage tail sheath C-terminal domain-containing protein [Allosphingosinicella sp.]|jgi:hypothetical protein
MPSALSYPGVYVEEIPSGVRTITGVATSITAFVGRTLRGPVNMALVINSYGEFERVFGGLWVGSPLSYAVRDFYLNGGSQAVVVRVFNPSTAASDAADDVATAAETKAADPNASASDVVAAATAARDAISGGAGTPQKVAANFVLGQMSGATTADGAAEAARKAVKAAIATAAPVKARIALETTTLGITLDLEAADPGAWGDSLRARVDDDAASSDLFNLSILDGETGTVELFRNVSVDPAHKRRVDKVLEKSALVRVTGALPAASAKAHPDPAAGEDIWVDSALHTAADSSGGNGDPTREVDFTGPGLEGAKHGLYALDGADLFNLLCIPPHEPQGSIEAGLIAKAIAYCGRRRAMMIVDPPDDWTSKTAAVTGARAKVLGPPEKNAALFFPRLIQANELRDGAEESFVPCGAVAGVFARTDATRGVWKAPAGLDATLRGVSRLEVPLSDPENGELNQLGVNCLRFMPASGNVIWGARTLEGADALASEWKYTPVRRLALYIEESLYRGTQWIVFEPNDEPLWASIRLNVGAFMQQLFRQGAFQGQSSRDAYFVKCDGETTTQADINLGIVNILVGFAPLKPAEFVILKIQQIMGNLT